MKVYQKSIKIRTKKLYDFVKMSEDIKKVVKDSKIKNGIVILNSLHNTAALIIQEDDMTIHEDLKNSLERIFPLNLEYRHDFEGKVNATAHLKSNFLGNSLIVPLKDNELILGKWQDLFFIELFEPRDREIFVTIIGE